MRLKVPSTPVDKRHPSYVPAANGGHTGMRSRITLTLFAESRRRNYDDLDNNSMSMFSPFFFFLAPLNMATVGLSNTQGAQLSMFSYITLYLNLQCAVI